MVVVLHLFYLGQIYVPTQPCLYEEKRLTWFSTYLLYNNHQLCSYDIWRSVIWRDVNRCLYIPLLHIISEVTYSRNIIPGGKTLESPITVAALPAVADMFPLPFHFAQPYALSSLTIRSHGAPSNYHRLDISLVKTSTGDAKNGILHPSYGKEPRASSRVRPAAMNV